MVIYRTRPIFRKDNTRSLKDRYDAAREAASREQRIRNRNVPAKSHIDGIGDYFMNTSNWRRMNTKRNFGQALT